MRGQCPGPLDDGGNHSNRYRPAARLPLATPAATGNQPSHSFLFDPSRKYKPDAAFRTRREEPGADAARLAGSRPGRQQSAETLIRRNATRAVRRPGEPRGVSPRVRRTAFRVPPDQRRGTYPDAKNPGNDATMLLHVAPPGLRSTSKVVPFQGRPELAEPVAPTRRRTEVDREGFTRLRFGLVLIALSLRGKAAADSRLDSVRYTCILLKLSGLWDQSWRAVPWKFGSPAFVRLSFDFFAGREDCMRP